MRLVALFCGALVSMGASAATPSQVFACGGADVRIQVAVHDSKIREDRAEGVVTVVRHGRETILRYPHVDFIGGQCLAAARPATAPLVVFQAYCGGSGCKDRGNWGVVDPESLRVLIVPDDANRAAAQGLVGERPLPEPGMMRVSE